MDSWESSLKKRGLEIRVSIESKLQTLSGHVDGWLELLSLDKSVDDIDKNKLIHYFEMLNQILNKGNFDSSSDFDSFSNTLAKIKEVKVKDLKLDDTIDSMCEVLKSLRELKGW
jgi:hypothetical protein